VKCSWEYADLPGEFNNNSLCKIWRANRVHYGQLEKWKIEILLVIFNMQTGVNMNLSEILVSLKRG